MLSFRPITLDSKEEFDPYLKQGPYRGCEAAFASLYQWQKVYRYEAAVAEGFLFVRFFLLDRPYYLFPFGRGDLAAALDLLGPEAVLFGDDACLECLRQIFPDRYVFEEMRQYFDYVYAREDLASLSGKRYHSKRNFIHRFDQQYSYTFSPLTAADFDDCMGILSHWGDAGNHADENQNDPVYQGEYCAIVRSLRAFRPLGLAGGILRVGQTPVAFALGSWLDDSVFVTHFEKALTEYEGAYAVINRELARQLNCAWINREDDLGKEGLRKAKLSYCPAFLVKKYAFRPRPRSL